MFAWVYHLGFYTELWLVCNLDVGSPVFNMVRLLLVKISTFERLLVEILETMHKLLAVLWNPCTCITKTMFKHVQHGNKWKKSYFVMWYNYQTHKYASETTFSSLNSPKSTRKGQFYNHRRLCSHCILRSSFTSSWAHELSVYSHLIPPEQQTRSRLLTHSVRWDRSLYSAA